jgi:glycosyltransferase involved in cell wall biosynthesis
VLNAQNVARVALDLKASGFVPDVMLGHNGWGEIWYLKDVFPHAPLIGYFEFFYRRFGADVGFDPAEDLIFDTAPRLRTKNLGNLLGLDAADMGLCPTNWQKSVYPSIYHHKLSVVHDGVDTAMVRPNPDAHLSIPSLGLDLSAKDQVLTYVGRNLEPYRGFPNFMRSLPAILDRCPNAHVLIVGGDQTSYGPPRADGKSFRTAMLEEVGAALDRSRVHFLGKVPYDTFLSILQISSAHVYLTYPFVLSWSMLEAMAAGCLVIGSRTAPVEEVISEHENGLLVDFHSPADIAEKVIAALTEPAAFRRIRDDARRTVVERYDLKTVCLPKQLELLQIARENFEPLGRL